MTNNISVSVIEDDSVIKKIDKTTKKLNGKFGKYREVNEKRLSRTSSRAHSIFSSITSVVLVFAIVLSLLLCTCSFMGRLNRTVPTFAGYSYMQVVTGSMTAQTFTYDGVTYESGHPKGENIVIKSVDPQTLKVGDKIAFYVYAGSFNEYYSGERVKVTEFAQKPTYKVSFSKFFGFQPKEVVTASKANSKLVFHHIIEVYEQDGHRWFKTQGSSNGSQDYWVIKDSYVIGVYDDTAIGGIISGVLGFLTSSLGLILTLLLPLVFLMLLILMDVFKNIERVKLELDCIEEKRKITDDICVRYNVGYKMDKKSKYKILAQAESEEWALYISLLWKDGKAPKSIKKYALKKNLQLRPVRKRLEVNRACELMYKKGEKPEKIARYYMEEMKKIKEETARVKSKLKTISKNNKLLNKAVNA